MEKIITNISTGVVIAICFINCAFAQKQSSPYEIVIDKDKHFYSNKNNSISFPIYLNNNSNDTLYYTGTKRKNSFFSLNKNIYFHLEYDTCKQINLEKFVLPPHRSQNMVLYLKIDIKPDKFFYFNIKMQIHKLPEIENPLNGKDTSLEILSNNIGLRVYSNDRSNYPRETMEIDAKETNAILPNMGIYFLTEKDRKLYTIKVNEGTISKSRDTIVTIFKSKYLNEGKLVKVITVPVVIHNESDEPLEFYSWTCSWYDIYGTNSDDIKLMVWPCTKNINVLIKVMPHSDYHKDLPIIYTSDVKVGIKYQINIGLVKPSNNRRPDDQYPWLDQDPFEYLRYNKIWSNEITIKD